MDEHQHHILVYGTAMWLVGIANLLDHIPNLRVTCVNPCTLTAADHIAILDPEIILVEWGTWEWPPRHLPPDVPIIEINEVQSMLIIHTTCQVAVVNLEDLVQIIEEVIDKAKGCAHPRLLESPDSREYP